MNNWLEGEPPKDGKWYDGWWILMPGRKHEVKWNSVFQDWFLRNGRRIAPPDKHAEINLPEVM